MSKCSASQVERDHNIKLLVQMASKRVATYIQNKKTLLTGGSELETKSRGHSNGFGNIIMKGCRPVKWNRTSKGGEGGGCYEPHRDVY